MNMTASTSLTEPLQSLRDWLFIIIMYHTKRRRRSMSVRKLRSLKFLLNSIKEMPPCHRLRPSSSIPVCLPLPLLPLIITVVTIFYSAPRLHTWPRDTICLLVIVVCHVLFSFAFPGQSLLDNHAAHGILSIPLRTHISNVPTCFIILFVPMNNYSTGKKC